MDLRRRFLTHTVSVFLCAAIILLVYIAADLFPFGHDTLAWCDMEQQAVPLMCDFKDILEGRSGFFLSLKNAGGMNFYGVFFFFLASPFSFLAYFVPKASMLDFMNILVLLKLCCCALTSSVFFSRTFKKLPLALCCSLSMCYAMCGYSMLFYQNLIWLDVMYFFPLFLLSLLNLLKGGRIWPYSLCLSIMIVLNYYLSYMVILFTILASGMYLFANNKNARSFSAAGLGIGTGISLLSTAVVWLPSYLQIMASARISDLMANIRYSSFFTPLYTTLPFLFCTFFCLTVFSAVPVRAVFHSRRLGFLFALYLVLILPVIIEPINKIWHTGSYQAFPVRYGFMTVFTALVTLSAGLTYDMDNMERKQIPRRIPSAVCIMMCILSLFCCLLMVSRNRDVLEHYTHSLWGNRPFAVSTGIVFLVLCLSAAVIIIFWRRGKVTLRLMASLLLILSIIQGTFNSYVYIGTAARNTSYYAGISQLSSESASFLPYRLKNNKKYFSVNHTGALGYNTIDHYTSLTSKDALFTSKKLGYSSYWMEISSSGGSMLSDVLMANRYILSSSRNEPGGFCPVFFSGAYTVYDNPYVFPLAAVFGNTSCDDVLSFPENMSRIEYQQFLAGLLFGSKNEIVKIHSCDSAKNISVSKGSTYRVDKQSEGSDSELDYTIDVKGDTALYMDLFLNYTNNLSEPVYGSVKAIVNGTVISDKYPSSSENGFLCLGRFCDERVDVRIVINNSFEASSFGVFSIDCDRLASAVSDSCGISDISIVSNGLDITLDTADGSVLFLPIFYDEGFSASVNGLKTPVFHALDGLMCIPISIDSKTVSLRFIPKGFKSGMIISIIGIILFVIISAFRPLKKLNRYVLSVFFFSFLLVFFSVIALVYIMPVAVSLL